MKTLSGNRIAKIALGTWGLGGTYQLGGSPAGIPPAAGESPYTVIDHALNRGLNLLDCSATYGHAERVVGRAVKGRREDVFIAAKAGIRLDGGRNFSKAFLAESLEQSCRKLQIETVDLYQAALGPEDEAEQALDSLLPLKKQQRTRFIGLSVAAPQHAAIAIESGVCDSIQLCLNLLDTRCWDAARNAAANNMLTLIKSPLNKGVFGMHASSDFPAEDSRRRFLTPPVIRRRLKSARSIAHAAELDGEDLLETAIRFALSIPFADAILFGARRQKHIDDLLSVAARGQFDRRTIDRLKDASDKYYPPVADTFPQARRG